MATIKDITTKCKAGEIAEAYEIALQDWQNAPDDVWTQREVGWALYYYIKEDVEQKRTDSFYEHLEKLGELTLLDLTNDKLIYENLLWKVAEFAKGFQTEDFAAMDTLFSKIQNYHFGSSRPYSLLLQYFIKFEGWNQLADFIDWWDLNNLTQEDYEQFQMENGKKVMSLAERAYIAYSKALLKLGDQERIAAFIPRIEALMDAHPEMLYPGYFCGKLLIAQGAGKEEALKKVIPFVRKKINEFWAWQLMSDIFRDEPDKQLACLLRAVHCKTQESFLGKIRIRLAEIYIQRQDFPRAKYNIDKVSACYLQQGWKLPGQLQQWAWQPWLQNTLSEPSDPLDYKTITKDLLFEGANESIGVVVRVDPKNNHVRMVFGVKMAASANFGKWDFVPEEGMYLKFKYVQGKKDIKVLSAEKLDTKPSLQFVKEVSGRVDKRNDKDFAFLRGSGGDCFVSPAIVSKYGLESGAIVTATVVYNFNAKKDEWAWACVSINQ